MRKENLSYNQKEGSNRCISPVEYSKTGFLLFHHKHYSFPFTSPNLIYILINLLAKETIFLPVHDVQHHP